MGLGKKLFKTVVSDNVSSLVGTNKNDYMTIRYTQRCGRTK